ncbi:HlyD family efflux transporter periplasmic adaptor subunit [Psychromonas sp.]|uniref:HlyD family efflux transporter periplasmic adaptor subunit n=1 Tax=Psychromonas sp. TaxID=1884585 RepID=UPI0035672B62
MIKFLNETAHWLDWQCHMISDVKRGGVFLAPESTDSQLQRLALWPDCNYVSPMLESIAAKTIKDGTGITQQEINDGSDLLDYISYPLLRKNCVVGSVVLAITARSAQQRQAVLLLLQWGSAFMEKILERGDNEHPQAATLALNAVAFLSRNEPLAVAGYHLCNLLADSLDCSRVVFGLRSGLQVRVISMSHQLQFDRRIVRVSQIEFAMEECIEQNQSIILPASSADTHGVITTHAQQLLKDNNGSVCLIPLRSSESLIGVICLVCDKTNHFDNTTVKQLTTIADHIAPVIALNISNVKPAWKKTLATINTQLQCLIGSGYLRSKLIMAGSIIMIGLLTLLQTDHIITAKASVEGKIQQAIVAPFSSYIATASVRAGDSVAQDQILATLDDRDLRLEYEKWSSERDKQAKEYQQALAQRDRAQVSILVARIAQTDAQLSSIEEKLQHTRLRAPFSGLLVSGDWTQALGTPIERGQLLFEIIPAKNYRITLQVDEHDVAGLNSGQNANLRLTGLPEQSIQLRISRILPIASVGQGNNNFRVESEIVDPPQGLRPGMQGIAKIVVGRGSLLKVWTYSLLARLRLWAWSLGF